MRATARGVTGVLLLLAGLGAAPKPRELVVWSAAKPSGATWAKMGAKGHLQVRKGAGMTAGAAALELRFDGDGWRGCGLNWKGWHPADACDDVSAFTALVFYIRQETKFADANLTVSLVDNVKRDGQASNALAVVGDGGLKRIDGTWRRIVLPLGRFASNKPLQLRRLWGIDFSHTGGPSATFLIDHVAFAVEKVDPPGFAPGVPFKATARLTAGNAHPIHEGIYGVCGLPRAKLIDFGIPITRWGGNPSTRFNWKLNVDNGAGDWFFKNRGKQISRLTESGYLRHILDNQAIGATTYQTVPMIGWVAKDSSSHGFSVAKYGKQRGHEPGQADVGDGKKPDGSFITGNDPRDTSVPAPPEFIGEAVRFVARHAGRADAKPRAGVKYWALDNEPMLWNSTHRDLHPKPLTYDDLWDRTVRYAEAIKKADPSAKVAGFCSWGWMDLYYSAADAGADRFRTRADFHKHGKVPLCEWFIKKCGEYKRANGKALVDTLDIHWYPQGVVAGQGPYLGKGLEVGLNALRLRSTGDLWDPKYQQESWIRNADPAPVALLPRVKKWIARHNPGMEVCLGEYNFGGGDNVTGGLAQAEVFGILAREAVELAFLWHTPEGSQELAWQLFRNHDGKGGRFGDTYLPAKSDHAQLSVFAARRARDKAVTMALVNKDLHGECRVQLDLGKLEGTARAWRFDQKSAGKVVEVTGVPGKVAGSVAVTLPAASATMLVLTPPRR